MRCQKYSLSLLRTKWNTVNEMHVSLLNFKVDCIVLKIWSWKLHGSSNPDTGTFTSTLTTRWSPIFSYIMSKNSVPVSETNILCRHYKVIYDTEPKNAETCSLDIYNITLNIPTCFDPQWTIIRESNICFPDDGALRIETRTNIQCDIMLQISKEQFCAYYCFSVVN